MKGISDSEDIVKVLGNPYCLRIISACYLKENTVQRISKMHMIPIAVCYRKVNLLTRLGLLCRADHLISERGKRIYLYKTVLDNSLIRFSDGKVYVTMRFKDGGSRRFTLDG